MDKFKVIEFDYFGEQKKMIYQNNMRRGTTYHLNLDFKEIHYLSDRGTSNVDTSDDIATFKGKSTLEQRIILECQEEYISVEEIANRVHQSKKYLKNRIIREMV